MQLSAVSPTINSAVSMLAQQTPRMSVPTITSLFQRTIAMGAGLGATVVAFVSANVLPVSLAIAGLAIGVLFVWLRSRSAATSDADKAAAAAAAEESKKGDRREQVRTLLEKLQVPKLETKTAPKGSCKVHAVHDSRELIEKNGKAYCHYNKDHNGFEAGKDYLVTHWIDTRTLYLCLEAPEGTLGDTTPRTKDEKPALPTSSSTRLKRN